MSVMKAWVRALDYSKNSTDIVFPALIDHLADARSECPALVSDTEALSYGALADAMNRYACWAIENHIEGQTVGLLMHNCADYVAIWLGLTRVGCKVALLNTNLLHDGLLHCIQAADVKCVIGTDSLTATLASEIKVVAPQACWQRRPLRLAYAET